MKRYTQGLINAIVASVSYGTNPLFCLPLYAAGIGANSVLFYRYFFAVLIYGVWLIFVKRACLAINKNQILPLFFLGLIFSLSSLTLFLAFKYIAAGIACSILFIYPVIVAIIMAVFFKEKLTLKTLVSIVLTFFGVALLYNVNKGFDVNFGVILVLLSAFLCALYMVGIKNIKAIKHLKSDKLSFYVIFFGLFVYIVNLKFGVNLQILDKPFLWLCAIGLSLLPTVISLETETIAIKLVGSTTTAVLGALEPLTAIFFGVVFFGERLTFKNIIGVILIILGVTLVVFKEKIKLKNKTIDSKKNF